MTMPNFLVIGAAKAGTTSIWQYLRQHRGVYLSQMKHTRFFAYEGEDIDFRGPGPRDRGVPWAITDLEEYRALFERVTAETAVGEVAHSYLYNPKAPHRIRHHVPDAKLIAILRNPVDRAHSHFLNMVRAGREPLTDFDQALSQEEARIRDNWWPDFHYTRIGSYHEQLSRYFALFDAGQIRIYLYEDLDSDPSGMMEDLFGFLGVGGAFVSDPIRYKVSGIPKNRALHKVFMGLEALKPSAERLLPEKQHKRVLRAVIKLKNRNLHKPRVTPEVRKRLMAIYRDDIVSLQGLIGRDLSEWLE